MATENPSSRQQSAERAQGAGSSAQQGAGSGQRGQGAGASAGAPSGQSGMVQSGVAQPGTSGGAMSASQRDWRGGSQGRYGVPAQRGGGDIGQYFGGGATSPFTLMRRITDEMDRLFESFGMGRNFFPEEMSSGRGGQGMPSLWQPHLEVFERNGRLMVQMDLPGVRREDVDVHLEPDAIIVQGQRTQQSERNERGVYHSERRYGSFYRTIPLPEGVDIDQASATFRDGVLEIDLPMPQRGQRGRQLEVRDGGSGGAGSGAPLSGTTNHPAGNPQSGSAGSSSPGGLSGASGASQGATPGSSPASGGSGASSVGGQHGSGGTR